MLVKFLADPIDADAQLSDWRLDRSRLSECVLYAQSFFVECTANDPKGFAGTMAYSRCGRRLRDLYAGKDGWVKDETNNQTAIKNDELKIRLYPCNFDSRTASPQSPVNLTEKGSAAKADTFCNAQLSLFDTPEVLFDVEESQELYRTLLLGMNFEGDFTKAEVSYPVSFNRKRFTGLSIRVPLLNGIPPESAKPKAKTGDAFGEVDIQIVRRT